MKFLKKFSFERIGDRDFPLRVVRMSTQDVTWMHYHEFTELVIVYGGKGLHSVNGSSPVELERGNVFVIPQGAYHQYLNDGLSLLNIIFETSLLPLPLLDVYAMPYFNAVFKGDAKNIGIFKIEEDELEEVLSHVGKLEAELKDCPPGCQFMATALFMQIIMSLARFIGGKLENRRSLNIGISRAIEYLHKHFKEKVSMEKLAENTGMSTRTLHRHFKRINGSSPKEYLIKLRLNHACDLLNNSQLGIEEIAETSGFEDNNYFSRQFRKSTGLSPREFREISGRGVKA